MAVLKSKKREFIPGNFKITNWENLKPYYENLLSREIDSPEALQAWFRHRSELESIIEEDAAWRYIHMTCDTASKEKLEAYTYFVTAIEPEIAPYQDKLNRKILDNPHVPTLKSNPAYAIMLKLMEKEVKIFRKANIPLKARIQSESQKFAAISGDMTIDHNGRELTLQQAGALLEEPDRSLRKDIYRKINERRLIDKTKLDELFEQLIALRHQVARNADYDNYRDYMFTAMGRMDYTPEDCKAFHDSVKMETVPILDKIARHRKEALGVDRLRPWDKAVDATGKPPLKPFGNPDELVEKTISCFRRLDPFFADCLSDMRNRGFLDLDSRKGKAPGGYNYPLAETGAPFIFMNASSTLRDLVTMVHEGGHAVHSYLMRDLELNNFRQTPSEIAELASMTMELLTMEHWDVFFENEADYKRAKREHLEQIIETLPWVAAIDKFQHWIYEHPSHQREERHRMWKTIFQEFSDDATDWSDLEEFKMAMWQKQLHLYEVPFYYIEYGMAQLGAIAIWKNYRQDPDSALQAYKEALSSGYTRAIPQIYETARIKFDFSGPYIKGLMAFVNNELENL